MFKFIKWPILSAFLIFSLGLNAQLIEFGGGLGTMSYAGDLSRGIKLANQNFGFQGHYRMKPQQFSNTIF